MQRIFTYSFLLALILGLSNCRKDVVLELPEYTQKVVIEASIETGSPAIVFLSWSVPYFAEFDYTKPETAFIKGGIVTITNGKSTEKLTEIDPTTGYVYLGTTMLGEQGKTYTLSVTVSDRTYTASTTIGTPAKLDTVYFMKDRDSLGYIGQRFSEPEGSGAAYRWFAKRLGRDQFYAAPFNSVFDDKFVDGKAFDFYYDRGPQPNQIQQYREDPERGFYKLGDKVVVKLCTIGRAEYDFWYTYYQNKSSNSNPFSAPANIKSMFSDYEHSFGAFVGYSPSYDTLVLKNKP